MVKSIYGYNIFVDTHIDCNDTANIKHRTMYNFSSGNGPLFYFLAKGSMLVHARRVALTRSEQSQRHGRAHLQTLSK